MLVTVGNLGLHAPRGVTENTYTATVNSGQATGQFGRLYLPTNTEFLDGTPGPV